MMRMMPRICQKLIFMGGSGWGGEFRPRRPEMGGGGVDGCGTGFQPVRGMLERVGVDDWAGPFAWAGSPCHAERFAWAGSPCHVELFAWAGSPCDRFATVESPCRSSAAPRAR